MGGNAEWGLVAYGRSGDVEVQIDESLSDSEVWELSIETNYGEFRFRILSIETVDRMHEFLNASRSDWDELQLGEFSGEPVLLIADHPPEEQYWVRIVSTSGCVEFRFVDSGLTDLRAAVESARRNLNSE
ncbi:MAG: hypothetical protein DWQ34_16645 [Planctomycetota bacterium]|nr:MAG: hypothetical protein DWQ29_09545 [Planctomycetota bacterium]REJ90776.1 MAG: hypothetical protein DWQ34_16645 [Planctomycetota bacterium]REK30753.1 MAG: hypothetical protein DWQ41_02045 [Planctomycetota bacterium]REK33128.1 MAG: hypothetical protein DWQ45_16150 [Planctomycetota bacterium]